MEELPICVVVPSFNNIANNRYKANMNSILQQNYQNFHIVFIDDASTDQTFNKTLDLIRSRNFPMDRVTMIRNDIQKFAMYNLRRAAMEFCKS
jgi:glycosyltransferase involved in cell wall biosynthesis